MKIDRSKTKFQYAISNPKQLRDFLQKNKIPSVAFIGRSNVGKSSLINAIFGKSTAKVSKTPGRTQAVNVFTFGVEKDEFENEFILYDLPGYGFAKVSTTMKKNWNILINDFFSHASNDCLFLNLQDSRNPAQKTDIDFYQYIKKSTQEKYLILNKIDKLKTQKDRNTLKNQMEDIYKTFKKFKQIYKTSAEKKTGVDQLEESIIKFLLKTPT